jgi:hypothetical protein
MEVTSAGLAFWLQNGLVGFVPGYMIGWLHTFFVIPKASSWTVISLLLSTVMYHCLYV